ncbi:MAG: tRNA 2-thiocytidine(32) synthetase TtcA [Ruminococcaceae bacterium]|nr:tRNA 2-thiocytidine(32) synthetase TtcA [Oscillospiraceae bacterium]
MQHLLSKMRRAVDDYGMIKEGDRIAVGLSGGKDSLTVLAAAKALQRFYPNRFHLEAITLDMGMEGMDFSPLATFCESLSVPFHLERTEIKQIVFDWRKEKNPCSLCANLRRGALNSAAKERGLSKIMLGHHHDDVIETFLLSLIFEGRASCFSPVTYLNRMDVTLLRPFIYVPEADIKKYTVQAGLPVVKNLCPADGNTKRTYIKELLNQLERENHGVKQRLFTALRGALPDWQLQSTQQEE